MKKLFIIILILATASCSNNNITMFVGSYSAANEPGIYVYSFNTKTGKLVKKSEVSNILNPSFLAISNDNKNVYAVSETSENASVQMFEFTNDGLKYLSSSLVNGADPCYINVNEHNNFIITANYSGGNLTVVPVENQTLNAAEVWDFNDSVKSHMHCAVFSPDNKYLFASDLGKDRIYRFSVEYNGLNYNDSVYFELEKGSGPRHITFHPNGKYVYVINELSGKVTAFNYSDGILTPFQYIASDSTSGTGNKGSADIRISPDGKFLYSSNRLKADGISIFSIEPKNGVLNKTAYQDTGAHPRNFIISPDGNFLLVASKDGNDIEVFKRDFKTGLLKTTGITEKINKPVCLIFEN